MTQADATVQTQFGRAATAYVHSKEHAGGDDLARIVALAAPTADHHALDIATGGGHTALALARVAGSVTATDLTPEMLAAADLLVGYRTYPHIDTVDRGREAVERLLQLREGHLRPVTAMRVVPLLAPLPPQRTSGPTPMAEVMARADQLMGEPGVVGIEVAGGFPYADVPGAGVTVRVTTGDDRLLAETLADRMAAALWHRRERFRSRGLTPDEAIDRALSIPETSGPVVLADIADNPGAGASGHDTALLERLLARGVQRATLGALPAPDAVSAAFEAGEGATVRVRFGTPRPGQHLDLSAHVRALSDGVFTAHGPMASGSPTRLGRTALLGVDGVEIVVCERRVPVIDPALFRLVGVEPSARRILAVKSSVHFRAAFEPLAAAVVEVETSGLTPSDLTTLPYRRVRRPIVPLDPMVRYLD